jgi:hypothetical protein
MNLKDEMDIVCNMRAEMMNTYVILVGNCDGKGSPARPGRRWEFECRTVIQEAGRLIFLILLHSVAISFPVINFIKTIAAT